MFYNWNEQKIFNRLGDKLVRSWLYEIIDHPSDRRLKASRDLLVGHLVTTERKSATQLNPRADFNHAYLRGQSIVLVQPSCFGKFCSCWNSLRFLTNILVVLDCDTRLWRERNSPTPHILEKTTNILIVHDGIACGSTNRSRVTV